MELTMTAADVLLYTWFILLLIFGTLLINGFVHESYHAYTGKGFVNNNVCFVGLGNINNVTAMGWAENGGGSELVAVIVGYLASIIYAILILMSYYKITRKYYDL